MSTPRKALPKTVKAWAVIERKSGYMWTSFIGRSKRKCIAAFIKDTSRTWRSWSASHQCVRVSIIPVAKKRVK